MRYYSVLLSGLLLSHPATTPAAIIGTNVPATPLTAARVVTLPAWQKYFSASQQQRQRDRAFIREELQAHRLVKTTLPPKTHSAKGLAGTNPPRGTPAPRPGASRIF